MKGLLRSELQYAHSRAEDETQERATGIVVYRRRPFE